MIVSSSGEVLGVGDCANTATGSKTKIVHRLPRFLQIRLGLIRKILRQSAKSAGKSMALQEATHLFGKPSPDPLSRSDFLDTRFPQPIDRPKLSQQQIFAVFTHPGAIIENTFVDSFLEQKLVIRVREPMRFVPDSLKQVERAGSSWQVQRHRPTRPMIFLVLLRSNDERQM